MSKPDTTMADSKRWVGYKLITKSDRTLKLPVGKHGGAKSNDPETWMTYADAQTLVKKKKLQGLGFMLGDGWHGFDFDDAVDAESGKVNPAVEKIAKQLNSFAEKSVSGTGVHVIVRGKRGDDKSLVIKKPGQYKLEVYSKLRFFALTFDHLWNKTKVRTLPGAELDRLVLGLTSGAAQKSKVILRPRAGYRFVDSEAAFEQLSEELGEGGEGYDASVRYCWFFKCPGVDKHTEGSKDNDFVVYPGPPIRHHCFHSSCESARAEWFKELHHDTSVCERDLNNLPEPLDIAEFMATKFPPRREIFRGLVSQGEKMIVGSSAKSGKTWMLLQMAMCAAAGRTFLDYPAVDVSKVLFANFEIHSDTFQQRCEFMAKALGIELDELRGSLSVWNLRGFAAPYEYLIPLIQRRIEAEGFQAIVLDPMYMVAGDSDENSNRDVTNMMNEFERLAKGLDVALLASHHFVKGGVADRASIDRFSGAGAWGRSPDVLMTLTSRGKMDAKNHNAADSTYLLQADVRNRRAIPDSIAEFEFPRWVCRHDLDVEEWKSTSNQKYPAKDVVLPAIRAASAGEWVDQAPIHKSLCPMTFSVFALRRQELVQQGLVEARKVGRAWQVRCPQG